jgi:hypothetical protein
MVGGGGVTFTWMWANSVLQFSLKWKQLLAKQMICSIIDEVTQSDCFVSDYSCKNDYDLDTKTHRFQGMGGVH